MRFNLSNEELNNVNSIKDTVESDSKVIDKIVDDIINPYCKDLDAYVLDKYI